MGRSLEFAGCLASVLGWTAAGAATLEVTVHDRAGHPVPDVLITATAPGAVAERRADAPLGVMDQIDQQFVPEVLVVQVGTSVVFPNSDTVAHQVYSFSPAKRFALGLYRGRIDDRAGYYVGGEFHYADWLVARALHYDNRGDPAAFNGRESAWLSRFDAIGARIELPADFTIIAQWMGGDTSVGESPDGRGFLSVDYDAMFVLLSKAFGRHRVTVRYDDFYTDTVRNEAIFDSTQDGDGWLLAYLFDYDEHWRFAVEALEIDTTLAPRAQLGLPTQATERTLQLAVAYRF